MPVAAESIAPASPPSATRSRVMPAEGVPHGAGLGPVGGEGPQPHAGERGQRGEVAVDERAAQGRALQHVEPAERVVGVGHRRQLGHRDRPGRAPSASRSAANRPARRRADHVTASASAGHRAAQSSRPASAARQNPCIRVRTPASRDRSRSGSSRSRVALEGLVLLRRPGAQQVQDVRSSRRPSGSLGERRARLHERAAAAVPRRRPGPGR